MQKKIGTIKTDNNGFNAIAALAEGAYDFSFETLELDFCECSFFDANMAAPLYAVLTKYNLCEIKTTNLRNKIEKIFQKNGFLCELGFPRLPDTNQTTLPFRSFSLDSIQEFNIYLSEYMRERGIPSMTEGLRRAFLRSLLEIFQNAVEHSFSDYDIYVCGQFFPNLHRLDFTIADAGMGIRENVRRHLNNKMNSIPAIKWVLEEGHSTKKDKLGGLGLKLIKSFVMLNKGKVQIVSRYGFYEFSCSGETFSKLDHDFPGTCVNIEINTNDPYGYALQSELKSSDIF